MSKTYNNALIRWIDHRLPIFTMMDHELNEYPTPRNLNYWWNFGSLAGIVLVIMIVTGIMLAMQYTAHAPDYAFDSVERVMRDVNYGWLLRYIHMNGGSFFFIVVFIHIFRGLYYGSYKAPRELLWMLGVVILLIMMATAFMGYVLPWGQMSFWGAKVITNLFSAIPWHRRIDRDLALGRLYGRQPDAQPLLRAALPAALRDRRRGGSTSSGRCTVSAPTTRLGIDAKGPQDKIPFHPYYTIKDMFGLGIFLLFFAWMVFFCPNYLGEPDNYIEANPLSTPAHIVPEWYFLPFYAILRSIPLEAGRRDLHVRLAILILCHPALDRSFAGAQRQVPFRSGSSSCSGFSSSTASCLGYIGAKPAEGWWLFTGRVDHRLVLHPLLGRSAVFLGSYLERPKTAYRLDQRTGAARAAVVPPGLQAKPMEKA